MSIYWKLVPLALNNSLLGSLMLWLVITHPSKHEVIDLMVVAVGAFGILSGIFILFIPKIFK